MVFPKPKTLALFFGTIISCYATLFAKNQSGISGHVNLDSSWNRVVYLSLIPNFSERFTLSSKYIIDETAIDKQGNFQFGTEYFPQGDALYRIHFTKKGDPAATLILGGPNENFCFLIANRNTHIDIKNSAESSAIRDLNITGFGPNQAIAEIKNWTEIYDSVDFSPSSFKAELISDAYNEKMRQIADTSRHPLVALFALYQSDFEQNHNKNTSYYNGFREKWQNEKSSYFAEFNAHFDPMSSPENSSLFYYAGAFFLIGFAIAYVAFGYKKQEKQPLENLSVQEKKIYALLKEGKSNKEISEEFNIGLSTVKSHVSSILTKMKVKSRKELMEV